MWLLTKISTPTQSITKSECELHLSSETGGASTQPHKQSARKHAFTGIAYASARARHILSSRSKELCPDAAAGLECRITAEPSENSNNIRQLLDPTTVQYSCKVCVRQLCTLDAGSCVVPVATHAGSTSGRREFSGRHMTKSPAGTAATCGGSLSDGPWQAWLHKGRASICSPRKTRRPAIADRLGVPRTESLHAGVQRCGGSACRSGSVSKPPPP